MTLNGKHALITGGGTGIGLAIAHMLVERGAHVTITGRRQEVLEEVATAGMTPMAMDVRNEDDVVAKIAAAVAARHIDCCEEVQHVEGRDLDVARDGRGRGLAWVRRVEHRGQSARL